MTRPRAMVTGASSGIGAAYAEELAGSGHDLVIIARREARLRALAERLEREHGVEVHVRVADLSAPAELNALVDEVEALQIDLLVNNAGFGAYRRFVELDPATAQALVSVQVLAPTLLARAALPGMVARVGAGSSTWRRRWRSAARSAAAGCRPARPTLPPSRTS